MNPAQHILVLMVGVYRRTLSPAKAFVFGPQAQCRFTPSCSQYAIGAVKTHGAIAGSWLAIRRVCRCNPWGGCGHDPVPGSDSSKDRTNGSTAGLITEPVIESSR